MILSSRQPRRIITLALLSIAFNSTADDLIYVYSPYCGACMKWQAEIAPIYPKTAEARALPLIKVSLQDWQTGKHTATACEIDPVLVTPTFIQVHQCKELDRITGYSNDELFWFALQRIANRSNALD